MRLTVHRTNGHIYAQITSPARRQGARHRVDAGEGRCAASSRTAATRKAAEIVGQRIAAKAKEKGIEKVAFDRAGYRYHGRVKALADAARAGGLKF